jgi:sugar-specific transcriptional regulator TrmB
MFDNLLCIFTKNNLNINIKEIENTREIKRLNIILIKKNTELKILQYKYNKLLNECIQHELNKKKDISINSNDIATDITPDITLDITPDIAESAELYNDVDISTFNIDISEYEKI